MEYVTALQWDKAEDILKDQMSLELDNNLPPLSFLLRISIRVFRIQNDEYDTKAEKKQLLHEIDRLTADGMTLADFNNFPSQVRPTLFFIQGGIQGFTATLQVRSNPMHALLQGFKALKNLDSARILEPRIKDAYLGSGLFNCILSKYPALLKSVLRLMDNHKVSMNAGLSQLRICAEQSRYTRYAARLYLAQYLSPYLGDQAEEKRAVYASLHQEYPDNPYFVFLANDEALTFYPDSMLRPRFANRLLKLVPQLSTRGSSCQRYVNLIKWQYSFIDTTVSSALTPSPISPKAPFSYYPAFVAGLRILYRLQNDHSLSAAQKKDYTTILNHFRDSAENLLDDSGMHPVRKDFFAWHIREGLTNN
jgi:hypothetical protein